jgi:carbonic anhydrase
MHKLIEGIQHFQQDDFVKHQELFRRLSGGQQPVALFITCADSRIDPNLLTHSQPGELFILRTAGNIVPPYGAVEGGEAATIEYAVRALQVRDIIICGHSMCGAMSGLLQPDAVENLPAVKAYLKYAAAAEAIVCENFQEITDESQRLTLAVKENVRVQLENLRTHPAVAAALARGDLNLHGWVYKFESGEVYSYKPEESRFSLMEGTIGEQQTL